LFGLIRNLFDGICKLLPLTGTDPFQVNPLALQPQGIEDSFQNGHTSTGLKVATHIVAFAWVSSSNENSVGPQQERTKDVNRVHRSRAHDPDRTEVWRILETCCPREVGRGGGTPIAEKADNLRFKFFHL
jgi:hypothetical protein